MYPYETLFVLRSDVPEAQVNETIERAKRLIESMGGTVKEVHEWGVRDLAYPIKKERRGYYILIEYRAEPRVAWELERTLKIADEVLRFVTVRQQPVRESSTKRAPRAGAPGPEGTEEIAGDEDLSDEL